MAAESSRKRQKGNEGQSVNLSFKAPEEDALGPVFAVFPSSKPLPRTPYTLYSPTGHPAEAAGPSVLAAQTDQIIFESRNQLGTNANVDDEEAPTGGEGSGYTVQYLLGVHNPHTNTLTLHSAPLHSLSTSVLDRPPPTVVNPSILMAAQRATLGTTFGTKKAIREIRAQERNKVSHESFGVGNGVQSLLQSAIAGASTSLPSSLIIEEQANLNRPIPTPNFDAKEPKDVYKMDEVVSRPELEPLNLEILVQCGNERERERCLPFWRSKFISTRMRGILPNNDYGTKDSAPINLTSKDEYRLQLLVHLSILFFLRQETTKNHGVINKSRVMEKLGPLAKGQDVVAEKLLERFTEVSSSRKGEEERKMTSGMEIKLLSYLLVIVLRLDNWSTEIGMIANDLAIGEKRTQELFRSLGCSVVLPSKADKDRLVASGAVASLTEAGRAKKAVLKVPLAFPKERRGAAKR